MFDHLSLGVADLDRAVALHDAALEPLGLVRLWRTARAVGYGPPGFTGEAPLALIEHGADARPPGAGFHLALAATSREAVDRFHAAAVAHGAIDDGPPGIREQYGPGYYAAFVRDPDGHRLEAVLHEPVAAPAPSAGTESIAHGAAERRIDRGDLHWIAPEDAAGPAAAYQHPHLVVQDDVLNHSRIASVVVVALTSNLHRASEPGNVLLEEGEGGLPRRSVVVVSQIAAVDKRRLGPRIGCLSQERVDAVLAGLRFQQVSFFER